MPTTAAPRQPSLSLITPDPGADEARRRGLRRMRTVAVGLLLLAACVYAATLGRDGFWGFVNAGAEASMVGAIADWFAVTALFRYPLGIKIPHTAIVPTRKDRIGGSLGRFVERNFLSREVLAARVGSMQVGERVAEWLQRPESASRLAGHATGALSVPLTIFW